MKYAADCDAVFGYFLHHFPYVGMRGKDDEKALERMGGRMREVYEETFGECYIGTAEAGEPSGAAFCANISASTIKPAFCAATINASAIKPAFCAATSASTIKPAFCAARAGPDGAGSRRAVAWTQDHGGCSLDRPAMANP
jgi:hypothetical protein